MNPRVHELSQSPEDSVHKLTWFTLQQLIALIPLYARVKAVFLNREEWAKLETEAPSFFPTVAGLPLELISSYANSDFNLLQ